MANTVLVNTVPNYPDSVVTANNTLYYSYTDSVIDITSTSIKSINLQNPAMSQTIKTYSINTPLILAVDATYLYVTYSINNNNYINNYIDRIALATNVFSSWFNEQFVNSNNNHDIGPMTIVGNYLYYLSGHDGGANNIFRINISDTSPVSSVFLNITGLGFSLVNDGTYLYFETITLNEANQTVTSYIAKCNASNPADYNPTWFKLQGPLSRQSEILIDAFTVAGNYLYAALNTILQSNTTGTCTLAKISLSNPAGDNNLNWFPLGADFVFGLTNDNTYLYLANRTLQTISKLPLPYVPISNICFPAGTPIQTDQGIISIEKIDTSIHTINGMDIQHITQTVTLDKYLISFGKNSIGRNIPSKTTIMSKDHQIEFEGKLVPAFRFLDFSREVKKVKYNGEILYNVLLDTYSKMNINNLMCETLHPDNRIAKLYNN